MICMYAQWLLSEMDQGHVVVSNLLPDGKAIRDTRIESGGREKHSPTDMTINVSNSRYDSTLRPSLSWTDNCRRWCCGILLLERLNSNDACHVPPTTDSYWSVLIFLVP